MPWTNAEATKIAAMLRPTSRGGAAAPRQPTCDAWLRRHQHAVRLAPHVGRHDPAVVLAELVRCGHAHAGDRAARVEGAAGDDRPSVLREVEDVPRAGR